MTKRDAISVLKGMRFVGDIDDFKRFDKAVETLKTPNKTKQIIKELQEEVKWQSGITYKCIEIMKKHGIKVDAEVDMDRIIRSISFNVEDL